MRDVSLVAKELDDAEQSLLSVPESSDLILVRLELGSEVPQDVGASGCEYGIEQRVSHERAKADLLDLSPEHVEIEFGLGCRGVKCVENLRLRHRLPESVGAVEDFLKRSFTIRSHEVGGDLVVAQPVRKPERPLLCLVTQRTLAKPAKDSLQVEGFSNRKSSIRIIRLTRGE